MKPNKVFYLTFFAISVALMVGSATAAEVSQGKCIDYDRGTHQITLEEYDLQFSNEHPYGMPTGVQTIFDVTDAMIGIAPEPGDILRLAWVPKAEAKSALRVMNVSKQDLRKK
jgi:hypothetical protein